jgi:hypothetical protein
MRSEWTEQVEHDSVSPHKRIDLDQEALVTVWREQFTSAKTRAVEHESARAKCSERWRWHTPLLASALRAIAINGYLLTQSVRDLRTYMHEAARVNIEIVKCVARLAHKDPSFRALDNFREILDALGGDDVESARTLAELTLKENTPKELTSHRYCKHMGRSVLAAVLAVGEPERHQECMAYCVQKNRKYAGYPLAMLAVYRRDQAAFHAAINEILRGHVALARNVVTAMDIEPHLCVWGIGMVRLARHRGMDV